MCKQWYYWVMRYILYFMHFWCNDNGNDNAWLYTRSNGSLMGPYTGLPSWQTYFANICTHTLSAQTDREPIEKYPHFAYIGLWKKSDITLNKRTQKTWFDSSQLGRRTKFRLNETLVYRLHYNNMCRQQNKRRKIIAKRMRTDGSKILFVRSIFTFYFNLIYLLKQKKTT